MQPNFLKSMLTRGAQGAPAIPAGLKGRGIRPSYGSSSAGGINPSRWTAATSKQQGGISPQGWAGGAVSPAMGGISPRGGYNPSISMPASPGPLRSSGVKPSQQTRALGAPSFQAGAPSAGPSIGSARPKSAGTLNTSFADKRMKSNKGFSMNSMSGVAQAGMVLMGGGIAGGAASYATGGNFSQGFGAGAVAGGAMFAGSFSAAKLGQKGAGGYASKVSNFMSGNENVNYRRAAFGGGAMLGGMMFGGNRSHKRGFNSRRGNSIGR